MILKPYVVSILYIFLLVLILLLFIIVIINIIIIIIFVFYLMALILIVGYFEGEIVSLLVGRVEVSCCDGLREG